MKIAEIPDALLLDLMGGRHSLFRRNRDLAYRACREMIRRREIELGWRRESVGDALARYWRDDNERRLKELRVIE